MFPGFKKMYVWEASYNGIFGGIGEGDGAFMYNSQLLSGDSQVRMGMSMSGYLCLPAYTKALFES